MSCAGLLLAAGPGERFGGPKALAQLDGRSLAERAIDVLARGGCDPIHVVLGAAADAVAQLLPAGVVAVRARAWADGPGESLRAGVESVAAADPGSDAVVVHLVDLPDVGADVVARVSADAGPGTLARATYNGVIGHPVVIGRSWWPALLEDTRAEGGRAFLRARPELVAIECADLATGFDVDFPTADIRPPGHSPSSAST